MPSQLSLDVPTKLESEKLGLMAAQTFNFPVEMFSQFVERVGSENLRVLRQDDQLVGGMSAYQAGQWFGGQHVPMAGIALVCVAPEHRIAGASRQMLTAALREFRERQIPLATLYASTQPPYRRVGFEQAGSSCLYEMSMSELGRVNASGDLNRVDPLAAKAFEKATDRRGQATNGNLKRTDGLWQRVFGPRDNLTPTFGYVVGDPEGAEGYIIYQNGPPSLPTCLHVRDMLATNQAVAETLWSFIGGHRSVFETVRWFAGALDPWLMLTAECRPRMIQLDRWMLRIIDLPRSLTKRGYSRHVNGQLDIEVDDETLPENSGRYRLRAEQGKLSVVPGGNGDLKTSIRGFAPLYSGFLSATSLSTLGRMSGTADALDFADALFGGPEPWMPDHF